MPIETSQDRKKATRKDEKKEAKKGRIIKNYFTRDAKEDEQ